MAYELPTWAKKLLKAREASFRELLPFREKRDTFVREFTGKWYGNNTGLSQPVNLAELAANVYSRQLISQNPRAMVRPRRAERLQAAVDLGLALDSLIKAIDLGQTTSAGVLDALLTVAIFKMAKSPPEGEGGYGTDVTNGLFFDPVSLNDWVHDTSVRRWRECQFMGNRYKADLEWVLNGGFFDLDKDAREKVKGSADDGENDEGETKPEYLTHQPETERDAVLRPTVELWDIYLPGDRRMVTLTAERGGCVLRNAPWTGPKRGPYHMLSLGHDVPDNIMPLAPYMLWKDLNAHVNVLFRKLARQAERQKSIGVGERGNKADADAVRNAKDGDFIGLMRSDAVGELKFGGPAPENLAFLQITKDIFTYTTGNLDALGGLSPQADTATQDQMMQASASTRISFMRANVTRFLRAVMEDIAFYLWNDPAAEVPYYKRLDYGGAPIDLPGTWTADDRVGDIMDYEFDIDPYSLADLSPAQRLMQIKSLLAEVYMPIMPLLAEQGIAFDAHALNALVARYSGMEELTQIFRSVEPAAPQGGEPRQSPNTTRTNVRVNRPGATAQQKDQNMANLLLGGNSQPAEKATAFRGVG